eukprot:996249-Pelagomonas_calceolata.AAC.1
MVESGRRTTDGGRLQALAALRERQEHLNCTRDARRARARERTAARRQVDDDSNSGALRRASGSGTDHQGGSFPYGGAPPLLPIKADAAM